MRLEKKKIGFLVSATTIALAGLLILQLYLSWISYDHRVQAFSQNVQSALNDVVRKLEMTETAARVIAFSIYDSSDAAHQTMTIPPISSMKTHGNTCILCLDSTGKQIEVIDTVINGGDLTYLSPGNKQVKKTNRYSYKMTADSNLMNLEVQIPGTVSEFTHISSSNKRRIIVEKVIDDLNQISSEIPLKSRIKNIDFDSLITVTLQEKGIQIPAVWGIINEEKNALIIPDSVPFRKQLFSSRYKSRLFPNDLIFQPNNLKVYFPDQAYYLFRQSGIPVIISIMFILIITISFYYTIIAIRKQKRFSQTLAAFINNMTHEFKTPISTISLAANTIAEDSIKNNGHRLKKYATIINDESQRMREQVEKILQMAELEEGKATLKKAVTNIHELLLLAVKHITLQVDKRRGSVTIQLNADKHFINADKLHMENIIYNVLDNALKYTEGNPEISIRTRNEGPQLIIEIEDNGIGMKLDDQNRVFEKYYRVPTGNIHNVKGFGLGLSYVELMTKAHLGDVKLKSFYQKGTTVILSLPVVRVTDPNIK